MCKENIEQTIHELKIAPKFFNDIASGVKKFEVRYNDRNFKVGDILKLREYADLKYTGNSIRVFVTYVLNDLDYCKDGFVVLGIER